MNPDLILCFDSHTRMFRVSAICCAPAWLSIVALQGEVAAADTSPLSA